MNKENILAVLVKFVGVNGISFEHGFPFPLVGEHRVFGINNKFIFCESDGSKKGRKMDSNPYFEEKTEKVQLDKLSKQELTKLVSDIDHYMLHLQTIA